MKNVQRKRLTAMVDRVDWNKVDDITDNVWKKAGHQEGMMSIGECKGYKTKESL